MQFENKSIWIIVFVSFYREVVGDPPNFRVLAPEFVCPNDENAVIKKSDNTVITVKTDATDLQLSWTVRWTHLNNPSQRFTLQLWKTVRALEVKLNAPQPEPLVYVINNTELLKGVEYIFNVTATEPNSGNSTTKRFAIDNIKDDPTLLIEGRSEKLSAVLVGGDAVYPDMEYVVDAEVTTCSPTQDYYFAWSVQSSSASPLELATSGSRLEIPPYSLQAGASYYLTSAVFRNSGEYVTQTSLPLEVLYRGLAVSLNFDVLLVTRNSGFDVKAMVENHDHYGKELKYEWSCTFENEPCENFESINSDRMPFPRGLLRFGQYGVSLTVTVQDKRASSNASIIVIESTLPVIQVEPLRRTINEHSEVTLVANASNVAPSCTLTWYFADEEYLASSHDTCENCQHGQELPGSVTIISLEEVFLNELTDFSNETEWRQVEAQMNASAGRARFVAQCGCSLTFSCDTQGTVYADVNFKLNKSPEVAQIKVFPETGTAMETVFRLSTATASDTEGPLRYSFYCDLGANDKIQLASNLEHMATETFLPFIDTTGTKVWVEVCDSLGACSSSEVRTVQLLEGEGRTVLALVASMQGHVARCEVMPLRRLVQSAVTTYKNSNQHAELSTLTNALLETLPTAEVKDCIKKSQQYAELFHWLIQSGVDLSSLIE